MIDFFNFKRRKDLLNEQKLLKLELIKSLSILERTMKSLTLSVQSLSEDINGTNIKTSLQPKTAKKESESDSSNKPRVTGFDFDEVISKITPQEGES